jgi:periplasmic divalent cation tolerance protein
MTGVSIIYITTKDPTEAELIASVLVDERFVACVNIVEKIVSRYRWEGKTVRDEESLLIAKTKSALVPAVIEKVKSIHGYSCPCIVALPIENGNEDFLSWVRSETR